MDNILLTSEQTDKFWPAFIKAKGEMGQPDLNCRNPHFKQKYADLLSCFKTIKEPFKQNNLNFTQAFGSSEKKGVLETRIVHVSGQWIAARWCFEVEMNLQKMGAQFTYLKRYHMYSMLGLAGDEDTDGQTVDTKTGKVEPIKTVKPYDPLKEPFNKNDTHHKKVFLAKLDQRNIDPSIRNQALEECHGKLATEWGGIIQSLLALKEINE